MRFLVSLLLILTLPVQVFAALGNDVRWEVQTTGDDNNGGGFDNTNGTPGVDMTQGAGQEVRSWLSSGGTHTNDLSITDASPSVMSSASYNFDADDVGNVINLTAGTNVTTGRYRIVSVAANAATLDRDAMSGTGSADASGYLGGALATIQAGIDAVDDDEQHVFVKAGSGYTITSGLTSTGVGFYYTTTRIVGYTTTREDQGYVTVTLSGSSITALTISDNGNVFENFIFDCDNQTGSNGINLSGNYQLVKNCKVIDAAGWGFNCLNYGQFYGCVAENCGGVGFNTTGSACKFVECWAKDNTSNGFASSQGVSYIRCRSNGNGGSGYALSSTVYDFYHCIADDNAGDGINGWTYHATAQIHGCMLTNNGDYGIEFGNQTTNGDSPYHLFRNNAFYNNTTGQYDNNISGYNDITLTADPYVDQASDPPDYKLNTGAADYATLKNGAAYNLDVGYYQHDDPPGGAFFFQPFKWDGENKIWLKKPFRWVIDNFRKQPEPKGDYRDLTLMRRTGIPAGWPGGE